MSYPISMTSSSQSFSSFFSVIDEEQNLKLSQSSEVKFEEIGRSSNSQIYSISINNSKGICTHQVLKVIKHGSRSTEKKGVDCMSDLDHAKECEHLKNEFKLLESCCHANIIKLSQNTHLSTRCMIDADLQSSCCLLIEKGDCDLLQMLNSVYPNVLEVSYLKYCFQKIGEALVYLHEEMKVAHNDVKLENIILFGSEPKLSDLGFASKHLINPSIQADVWYCRSKNNYPPEIISNIQRIQNQDSTCVKPFDERKTDVFAYGLALFNALFHTNPFTHQADMTDPLYSLLYTDTQLFWKNKNIATMLEFISTFHSADTHNLQKLLYYILHPHPQLRLTMVQVLRHPWFNQ